MGHKPEALKLIIRYNAGIMNDKSNVRQDKIAILDFGGQYSHLIANRVRRLNVYSEILPPSTTAEELKSYKGIILSGGPQSVYDQGALTADPAILELGVPLLGICYGHQLLAHMQGAKVEHDPSTSEYGLAEMEVLKAEGIFKGLDSKQTVWMSHGDSVKELPSGYEVIGATKAKHAAAVANLEKNFFGTQFHLEVTHTKNGMKMLDNFLDLCGVTRQWSMEKFVEQEMQAVLEKVGDKKVFMLVSGGVDSTVAFVLLSRALGAERVYGLFVDTGFLRKNERTKVEQSLRAAGFENLHVVDASARYFEALKEVYDPEEKRGIIGKMFLTVQAEAVKELQLNPDEWLIGQGTIYPDTIESGGTAHAAKIKTHHNRVPEIEELMKQGRIIEPLAQLYKDEVRKVGETLGISSELIWRHPFPGPGLAVRCLCAKEETLPQDAAALQEKINEELKELSSSHNTSPKNISSHLSATILPIQSVGVQGDYRTYKNPLAIMGTPDTPAPFTLLGETATQLINQHKEINRAIWLVATKDKANQPTIQTTTIQNTYLTPERIKLLQEADAIVDEFIHEKGLTREIWQFPTVLIPLSVNADSGESLVLRPFQSEEVMTANFYAMSQPNLKELTQKLIAIPGITAVFYDITNKPPGTIEWE